MKPSLSRTEAQPSNLAQVSPEVTVPAKASASCSTSSPGVKQAPLEEVSFSQVQQSGIRQSGARELINECTYTNCSKASSSKTEISRTTPSHQSHEVTVPAKAKALQVPKVFGVLMGPPPKPKASSPVGPESPASKTTASENPKSRTLARVSRAKAKPKPDPLQTRLVFAASGSADNHASQAGGSLGS